MDIINDYIKNICYYVILTTVIFNMFPNEKYMRYIKIFSGFVLILIIVYPITNYFENDFDFDEIVNEFAISTGGEELEENIDEYEMKIEERINEMATDGAGTSQ